MTIEVKIPIPDQTTEEVRLVVWRKDVGDSVTKGEIILEIETDKAVMEVEAAGDGVLLKQLVQVDDMVPVGEVIGFIGEPGTEIEVQEKKEPPTKPSEETVAETSEKSDDKNIKASPLVKKIAKERGLDLEKIKGTGANGKILRKDVEPLSSSDSVSSGPSLKTGRLFASPNAKRLAKELGIDISLVKGTGPKGRIVGKDVQAYSVSKPAALSAVPVEGQPKPGTEEPLTKMRGAIARTLQGSFRDTPHFNVTMNIDMTKAMAFRSQMNEGKEKSEKISVNDLVVKACAMALKQYPAVNSRFLEDRIKYLDDINVGVATAIETGLVVPVILNTDKLSWQELAAEAKNVIDKARKGKLKSMGKGTFTVSNLGMFGVEEFTAIINPPEAAILAVGGLKEEVVAENGTIGIKPMMKVTLCSDHRVIDGAIAAQFLAAVKRYLEEEIS